MNIEVQGQSRKIPPYQCTVEIHKQSIGIYSPIDNFVNYFKGLDDKDYLHDIPGWRIKDKQVPSDPKLVYVPADEARFTYRSNPEIMVVEAPKEDIADGQALAYLSYWLSEGQRQREKSFTIHAASVSVNDRGILLIGDRGAGKTSLMLGLAKKYPTRLIANDLTILSHIPSEEKVLLEEGSKRIRLRLRSVISRFPHLIPQFPDIKGSTWTTKVLVTPDQLGVEIESKPTMLSRAFLIHLSNIEDEDIIVKRASGIVPYFELYENLSRIIRGSAVSIFGSKDSILGFIPSLETEHTHNNKVALLDYLVKERGIWDISGGNLDQMCETIFNLSI